MEHLCTKLRRAFNRPARRPGDRSPAGAGAGPAGSDADDAANAAAAAAAAEEAAGLDAFSGDAAEVGQAAGEEATLLERLLEEDRMAGAEGDVHDDYETESSGERAGPLLPRTCETPVCTSGVGAELLRGWARRGAPSQEAWWHLGPCIVRFLPRCPARPSKGAASQPVAVRRAGPPTEASGAPTATASTCPHACRRRGGGGGHGRRGLHAGADCRGGEGL